MLEAGAQQGSLKQPAYRSLSALPCFRGSSVLAASLHPAINVLPPCTTIMPKCTVGHPVRGQDASGHAVLHGA